MAVIGVGVHRNVRKYLEGWRRGLLGALSCSVRLPLPRVVVLLVAAAFLARFVPSKAG